MVQLKTKNAVNLSTVPASAKEKYNGGNDDPGES